jgi:hypothetical protein
MAPVSRGSSHWTCCSLDPYLASTSMLPVSGALGDRLRHNGTGHGYVCMVLKSNGKVDALPSPSDHHVYRFAGLSVVPCPVD